MLSLLVWLMFGVVAVVPALEALTWQTVAYAVLSLTVIRMLPVAVALAGARRGPRCCSWAGSARAAWPRSSSRCSRWKTWPNPRPNPSSP